MPIKRSVIQKLRDKMEKEKDFLEKELGSFAKKSSGNPKDWNTKFPDFRAKGALDEEADEVEEYTSLLPIERALKTKLQNIEAALEKIAKKKYEKCESCGKEIEEKRLLLVPETKHCLKCKK